MKIRRMNFLCNNKTCSVYEKVYLKTCLLY
nr:MAG TPA: hypothetical protein [Caudoviricetes sp.]